MFGYFLYQIKKSFKYFLNRVERNTLKKIIINLIFKN